jgi:hypothetical protein
VAAACARGEFARRRAAQDAGEFAHGRSRLTGGFARAMCEFPRFEGCKFANTLLESQDYIAIMAGQPLRGPP